MVCAAGLRIARTRNGNYTVVTGGAGSPFIQWVCREGEGRAREEGGGAREREGGGAGGQEERAPFNPAAVG